MQKYWFGAYFWIFFLLQPLIVGESIQNLLKLWKNIYEQYEIIVTMWYVLQGITTVLALVCKHIHKS